MRQDPARHDLREIELARVEEHSARDGIEDQREPGLGGFHQQRALDHADAIDGEAAELGFLPRDLAALDVDARERRIRRDEQRAGGGDLLPAQIAGEMQRP